MEHSINSSKSPVGRLGSASAKKCDTPGVTRLRQGAKLKFSLLSASHAPGATRLNWYRPVVEYTFILHQMTSHDERRPELQKLSLQR